MTDLTLLLLVRGEPDTDKARAEVQRTYGPVGSIRGLTIRVGDARPAAQTDYSAAPDEIEVLVMVTSKLALTAPAVIRKLQAQWGAHQGQSRGAPLFLAGASEVTPDA